ncbi:MarR family winged helix-turn-helix transcriptional regulator [Erythrobacter sp. GH1-10]|uniref:MarR family winged helix-turn-helix transcriptional regulator n=1 Tax=Erythrobacter sp. GH1-10 TaxID=3349334 RepID=UPI0038783A02
MSSKQSRTYFQIQRTAALLQRAADAALLEAAGVTAAQAAVLTIVETLGSAKQKQLAEILHQNESAITQMVAKLEGQGLVERAVSPYDRRIKEVRCTQSGRQARDEAERAFNSINLDLDEALGAESREFLEQLQRIRAIFPKK